MPRRSRLTRCVAALAALATSLAIAPIIGPPAWAQTPDERGLCADTTPALSPGRYLRALSLHLTGAPPSGALLDEVAALPAEALAERGLDAVAEVAIDALLDDAAFPEAVVRRHRALLWPQAELVRLQLRTFRSEDGEPVHFRYLGINYRNRSGARIAFGPTCADRPAEYTEDGELVTWPHPLNAEVVQEGWIELEPHWAPGTTVRICGYDAQEAAVSPDGVDCATAEGSRHPDCGCGPALIRCAPDVTGIGRDYYWQSQGDPVGAALTASLERLVLEVIRADRPYLDVFTSTELWVNGPLSWYLRHMLPWTGDTSVDPARVPAIAFHQMDTWAPARLGPERAGVLTHPLFLKRFTRNRARGTHVLETLLCQPLSPPAGGLPPADPEAGVDPDLQRRDGCKYCHAPLEPAAAYFGRWAERGVGYLDPERYPLFNQACLDAAQGRGPNRPECVEYIGRTQVPKLVPLIGFLRQSVFLADHHLAHIDEGPAGQMRRATATGQLPRCVAQRTAEWLLGRQMDREGDRAWLDALARDLVHDGLSYRELVRAIVVDPRFRRVQ